MPSPHSYLTAKGSQKYPKPLKVIKKATHRENQSLLSLMNHLFWGKGKNRNRPQALALLKSSLKRANLQPVVYWEQRTIGELALGGIRSDHLPIGKKQHCSATLIRKHCWPGLTTLGKAHPKTLGKVYIGTGNLLGRRIPKHSTTWGICMTQEKV